MILIAPGNGAKSEEEMQYVTAPGDMMNPQEGVDTPGGGEIFEVIMKESFPKIKRGSAMWDLLVGDFTESSVERIKEEWLDKGNAWDEEEFKCHLFYLMDDTYNEHGATHSNTQPTSTEECEHLQTKAEVEYMTQRFGNADACLQCRLWSPLHSADINRGKAVDKLLADLLPA